MSAGRGWIVLALVVFATWRPLRVLLGAYLFGGVTVLQLHAQGLGVNVPSEFLSMLPYIATIVVLVLICRDPRTILLNQPASLGRSFHPDAMSMEAYLFEWLSLLGRWLHLIAGIAWIGASFYFVWLDNHLLSPATQGSERCRRGR